VAWCVLDAQFFGLAQRRRRVFVVAVPCELVERLGDRADPAEILSLGTCLRRDTPARPSSRQVSPTIPSRSTAGGGLGTDFDCDGGVVEVAPCYAPEIAACLETTSHDYSRADGFTMVTHALTGEGFDASEDGTGRGTPLVPVGVTIHGTDPTVQKVASYDDVAQCLRARTPGNIDNSSTTVVQQPVPFDTTQITSAANYSRPQPGDPCHPLAAGAHPPAIAFSAQDNGRDVSVDVTPTMRKGGEGGGVQLAVAVALRGREGGATAELGDEVGHTLRASSGGGDKPHVLAAMQVRRLTPEECEALQGFPRSYSAIPWRGKPASACPDGPRYKALGNSMAVPVMAWIGERIAAVEAIREEAAA
jgi:DNA (cytosine-5)-methyltransferase 1